MTKSPTDVAGNPPFAIREGGLDDARVRALITHHYTTARSQTACDSAHALDPDQLNTPDIRFFAAWDGDVVAAIGALKRLSSTHGEIKSMHTAASHRRRGAGNAVLEHLMGAARDMGMTRVSLETGSRPFFDAARAFYARGGFSECPPFEGYTDDPNSVYMTIEFSAPSEGRATRSPR